MKSKTVQKAKGRFRRGRLIMAAYTMAAFLCVGCADTYDGSGSMLSEGNYSMDSVIASAPEEGIYNAGGGMYDAGFQPSSEGNMEAGNTSEGVGGISDARKLITNVRLELETKEFEQTMSGIETQIRDMGGYIESMEAYNGSSYSGNHASRYSNMTIRIPASKLNGFMDMVSDVGNIIKRNDEVKDVTLSYVDMESRRDTLRTEQSRLLEFLDKADSVETVIALEERLSEVRYQLESMESQLRTIDNLVEYSTVNLRITEVKELTPVVEQTVWQRIGAGFSENLHDIGDGIVNLCVWFLINIPYFLIWAVIIMVVIVLLRKFRQKRRQRNEEREEEPKT